MISIIVLCYYLKFHFSPFLPNSLNHSVSYSITHSLSYSLTPILCPSLTHSFTPSVPHSLIHSLTHSLPLSLTHSLTHSVPHSFPHSLTLTPSQCHALHRTIVDTFKYALVWVSTAKLMFVIKGLRLTPCDVSIAVCL